MILQVVKAIGLALLLIVGAWTLGSLYVVWGVEEARYEVVAVKDGYEVRRYAPQIVAQTAMATMKDTGPAFRAIAGYIFGGNAEKKPIAMTAPVVMDAPQGSSTITMTAPVVMGNGTMAFVMPGKYKSIADLPKPADARVVLAERPSRLVAASRFGGYAWPGRFAGKSAALQAALARDGLRAVGQPVLAGYDPPFSIPFLKRNEVLIEVEDR